MRKKISVSKVVVVTHYLIYSASQALRDFLRKKDCKQLLYISHPLSTDEEELSKDRSFFEVSKKDNIIASSTSKIRFKNIIFNSFYEFVLTTIWLLETKSKYDLYVGVDNLNALQGLIFKKLGLIKKVVYYSIDYFPTRFNNPFLNYIYHRIDKFCVKHADETWNVSSQMEHARESTNNMKRYIFNRQYEVPIGIWFSNKKIKKFKYINAQKIVFVGHLLDYMGLDLVISSMPKLIKLIKGLTLDIIGGGEEENHLKDLVKKYKLEKVVTFYGWVRDRFQLEQILSNSAVGVAVFNTQILDEKVKNADPGKIKDYMQLGLPVIISDAVKSAMAIDKAKVGIAIKYEEKMFIKAVVKLLKNKDLLKLYRKNTISYIKKFDWANIFRKNIERVLNKK